MSIEHPTRLTIAFHQRHFFVRRFFFRLGQKITGNARRDSSEFISGDGFRKIADHVFDSIEENKEIPDIARGDIVFVASPEIKKFFSLVHPKIQNKYILITHNGDENIGEPHLAFIDEKIIHWFAQNVLVNHPKLTPIPIGLENMNYYQNGITWMYRKLMRKNGSHDKNSKQTRKPKILCHFKIATNPAERQPAFDYFRAHPQTEIPPHKVPEYLYLKNLHTFMYVASPPGNGNDCIRTWEALYLGTVPIVKNSAGNNFFRQLGLPLFVVEDWNELDSYDAIKLAQKYSELMNGKNKEILSMNYWISKIRQKQLEFK